MSKKLEYIASEKIKKDGDEKIPYCFNSGFCMYTTMKHRCSFKHPCRHKKINNFTYVRNDSDDDEDDDGFTVGDNIESKRIAKIIKARA